MVFVAVVAIDSKNEKENMRVENQLSLKKMLQNLLIGGPGLVAAAYWQEKSRSEVVEWKMD